MTSLAFTSALGPERREALERLLFFNRHQAVVAASVTQVTHRYGIPRIEIVDGCVRIRLRSKIPIQSLFVVRRDEAAETGPLGVVVYTRRDDALVVLFLALHEDYCRRGPHADAKLFTRVIAELRRIAARVAGVTTLVIHFDRPEPIRLRVRRDPSS